MRVVLPHPVEPASATHAGARVQTDVSARVRPGIGEARHDPKRTSPARADGRCAAKAAQPTHRAGRAAREAPRSPDLYGRRWAKRPPSPHRASSSASSRANTRRAEANAHWIWVTTPEYLVERFGVLVGIRQEHLDVAHGETRGKARHDANKAGDRHHGVDELLTKRVPGFASELKNCALSPAS